MKNEEHYKQIASCLLQCDRCSKAQTCKTKVWSEAEMKQETRAYARSARKMRGRI